MLLLALLLAILGERPHAAIGTVVIDSRTSPRPIILIAVDAADGGGRMDGKVDLLYVFHTIEPLPAGKLVFPLAHVDDFDTQLVVSAPVERMRFTFANEGQEPLAHSGPNEYVFADGHGLACYWGARLAQHVRIRDGKIDCGDYCDQLAMRLPSAPSHDVARSW
jgi:hypothetical protein